MRTGWLSGFANQYGWIPVATDWTGMSEEDIARVMDVYDAFTDSEQSRVFDSEAFGYWKVTVERPLRLTCDLTDPNRARFRAACADAGEEALYSAWVREMFHAPRGDDAMVRGAVGLMRAERDQAASVAVARTGDEMLGTLLDVVA